VRRRGGPAGERDAVHLLRGNPCRGNFVKGSAGGKKVRGKQSPWAEVKRLFKKGRGADVAPQVRCWRRGKDTPKEKGK